MIDVALDTSLGFALAVRRDGSLLLETAIPAMGRESDRILPPWLTEQLGQLGLKAREVERWTLGTGPGSFAGLRCGIALVKGVALVSGARLRGVPTSVAIAAALAGEGNATVGVLHDGRCGQVLLARVARGGRLLSAPEALDPDALLTPENACDAYATLQAASLPPLPESVSAHLRAAEGVAAARLLEASEELYPWPEAGDIAAAERSVEPLYVRQAVFVKPAELRR